MLCVSSIAFLHLINDPLVTTTAVLRLHIVFKMRTYFLGSIIEVHSSFDLVVSCDLKRYNLKSDEAWGHGQHFGPMSGLIQVFSRLWMGHASRVPAHDVEVGTSHHSSPTMPLNLVATKNQNEEIQT